MFSAKMVYKIIQGQKGFSGTKLVMFEWNLRVKNDLDITKCDVTNRNSLKLSSHIIDRYIRTLPTWLPFLPCILELSLVHIPKILKRHRLRKVISTEDYMRKYFSWWSWVIRQLNQGCYRYTRARLVSRSRSRFFDEIACVLLTWTALN